jgi:hypothetical protein
VSFLKEQINPANKPQVNKTFQLQIDAIRFAGDDLEKVGSIISQKKALLKKSNDIHESERLFAELDAGVRYSTLLLPLLYFMRQESKIPLKRISVGMLEVYDN